MAALTENNKFGLPKKTKEESTRLILGITGKAGSGFDTDVAGLLESYGFFIIRSDDLVDEVWKLPEVLTEIGEAFGKEKIYENPDNPNPKYWIRKRSVLGEIVANDKSKQDLLNDILEPYTVFYIYKAIRELNSQNLNRIALVSTRLARSRQSLFCNYLWYVNRKTQKRRKALIDFYKTRGFDPEYVADKVERTIKIQRDVKSPSEFSYDLVIEHPEDRDRMKRIINVNLSRILGTYTKSYFEGIKKYKLRAQKRSGQFIRAALSLSQLTGIPIFIEEIESYVRNTRTIQPSLIACVRACENLCNGKLILDLDKRVLDYVPGKKKIAGRHIIVVPSRTSVSQMTQTILPFSLLGHGRVDFILKGCTELNHSAPVNYFSYVFFPLLRKMGAKIEIRVNSRGFLEEPLGQVAITIEKTDHLRNINLTKKGEGKRLIFSRNSIGFGRDLDDEFADEMKRFIRSLGFSGDFVTAFDTNGKSKHKGVSMSTALETEHSFLGADTACDQTHSIQEQKEAFELLKERTKYILTTKAALDPMCADQILLYLAIAGGSVTIPLHMNLKHVYTQLSLINTFKEEMFTVERRDKVLRVTSDAMRVKNG